MIEYVRIGLYLSGAFLWLLIVIATVQFKRGGFLSD